MTPSPARRPLRIAQVVPLFESVPPKLYGGTERVVSYLTEDGWVIEDGVSGFIVEDVSAAVRGTKRVTDLSRALPGVLRATFPG
jgi:hypothetical protein